MAADRDSIWNSVAAASVAFDTEWVRFRETLVGAFCSGLSVMDLAEASGWQPQFVQSLLDGEP